MIVSLHYYSRQSFLYSKLLLDVPIMIVQYLCLYNDICADLKYVKENPLPKLCNMIKCNIVFVNLYIYQFAAYKKDWTSTRNFYSIVI